MTLKCSLATAIAIAAAAVFISPVQAAPLQLFQAFSDYEQTRPRDNEPFSIWLDGRLVDAGVTDERGAVVTRHHKPGTEQEFVLGLFGFGVLSVHVDSKSRMTHEYLGQRLSASWQEPCRHDAASCEGEGFYWLQLLGKDTHFENEPYVLRIGARELSGTLSEEGVLFVDQNDPPAVSDAMVLRLCHGPALRIRSGAKERDSSIEVLAPSEPQPRAPTGCQASGLDKYRAANHQLNYGNPYAFTAWSSGISPVAKERQAAREEQERLADYQRTAAANDDDLAWLGRLPKTWSAEQYIQRASDLNEKIMADVAQGGYDIRKFKCRPPHAIGPVPDIAAVDRYVEGFPRSMFDPDLRAALGAAAAKGNWLAVAQEMARATQTPTEGNIYVRRYRTLQLMEWLQARKLGPLYWEAGQQLKASGYFSDVPGSGITAIDLYAVKQGSYPAQFEVGKALLEKEDAQLREVGQKMLDCARNALPGYKKQFQN